MNTFSVILLSNGSATGAVVKWPGGRGVLEVGGNFTGGGTVSLHGILPNGVFAALGPETTLTANGRGGFDIGPTDLKVVVTGTVASMYCTASRVPS